MNNIKTLLEKLKNNMKEPLEKTEKYIDSHKFGWLVKPTFDAIFNIFFGPEEQIKNAPYARSSIDTKRFMLMAIFSMAFFSLMGVLLFGIRALLVIIVSYTAGGIAEVVFTTLRKKPITEGFLVTGMVFALTLPPTLPLWMVALGSIFGVVIGKEVFGGVGHNIFNPALVGRAFLLISFPLYMSAGAFVDSDFGNIIRYTSFSTDTVSSATPLIEYKQNGVKNLPLHKLLIGNTGGSIGETCRLGILIFGIFLLITKVSDWRTPIFTILSAILSSSFFHTYYPADFAPPLIALFSGSLLFASFYMAADPVTSPKTFEGRIIAGILIGFITILIRGFSGYPEGVTFAILITNALSPLIDDAIFALKYTRKATYGRDK